MPRLKEPDPLSQAIGQRIRELRDEKGLTLEQLAYGSELSSKGHLSNLERGLVRPTVQTLKVLADHLGVLVADLVNVPRNGEREMLIEDSRRARLSKVKLARKALGVSPKPGRDQ